MVKCRLTKTTHTFALAPSRLCQRTRRRSAPSVLRPDLSTMTAFNRRRAELGSDRNAIEFLVRFEIFGFHVRASMPDPRPSGLPSLFSGTAMPSACLPARKLEVQNGWISSVSLRPRASWLIRKVIGPNAAEILSFTLRGYTLIAMAQISDPIAIAEATPCIFDLPTIRESVSVAVVFYSTAEAEAGDESASGTGARTLTISRVSQSEGAGALTMPVTSAVATSLAARTWSAPIAVGRSGRLSIAATGGSDPAAATHYRIWLE